MINRILAAVFVLLLTLSFSLATFAQDAAKQEMKKDEKKMEMTKEKMEMAKEKMGMEKDKMGMTKDESAMGPLKSFSCDEACGFMVRSRDEKDVISSAERHIKKVHKMKASDAEIKEKMKMVEEMKK